MNKKEKLDQTNEAICICAICKQGGSGLPVPGEGNADADIAFIGEAPGRTEAETGRPFVGRSGKLLRSLIQSVGLKEEDVYITSPVKYLPDTGTPTPAQIAHGRMHLNEQLGIIEPKIIVLLGSTAIQAVLQEKFPVLSRHGTIVERNGRKYFLTLHPAAAIRFKKFKILLEEDFRKLKGVVSEG